MIRRRILLFQHIDNNAHGDPDRSTTSVGLVFFAAGPSSAPVGGSARFAPIALVVTLSGGFRIDAKAALRSGTMAAGAPVPDVRARIHHPTT